MDQNHRHRRLAGTAARAFGVVLLTLAATSTRADAIRLQGHSTTATYIQKVAEGGTGDEFENRTRLYERLRFTVLDLGTHDLSLHGFLTGYNDLTNWNIGDTRTRLYSAHLRYRSRLEMGTEPMLLETRLGRQWVASGVGSGTVDGLLVNADRAGWGGVTLFGGTLGMDTREQLRLDGLKDSRRFGGELRLRPRRTPGFEPDVAVSMAYTQRNEQDESQRIGGRAALRVRRQLRMWTEVRHDFALDRTYGQAAGVEFTRLRSPLRLWATYNRRTNALPATSYFAFWDSRPVSELRGGFRLGIAGPYRFTFELGRVDFKKVTDKAGTTNTTSKVDRANRYRFAIERGAWQAGLLLQSGFGGDRTGLTLRGQRDITSRLNVWADVDYVTYDYGDNVYEDNDATSGILAATYRVLDRTRVTAQVEGLGNWDLSRDVRLLLRLDHGFSMGAKGGTGR